MAIFGPNGSFLTRSWHEVDECLLLPECINYLYFMTWEGKRDWIKLTCQDFDFSETSAKTRCLEGFLWGKMEFFEFWKKAALQFLYIALS